MVDSSRASIDVKSGSTYVKQARRLHTWNQNWKFATAFINLNFDDVIGNSEKFEANIKN